MASESMASWAIDSEPIRARGIIVKYFLVAISLVAKWFGGEVTGSKNLRVELISFSR